MFVLIVTASVPTFQPLFRTALGLRSTARYASYSLRPAPRGKRSSSRGSRGVIGRGLELEYPNGTTTNPSTDHILAGGSSHPEDGKTGIVKTDDFSLAYSSLER